jgi:hypothetical protein
VGTQVDAEQYLSRILVQLLRKGVSHDVAQDDVSRATTPEMQKLFARLLVAVPTKMQLHALIAIVNELSATLTKYSTERKGAKRSTGTTQLSTDSALVHSNVISTAARHLSSPAFDESFSALADSDEAEVQSHFVQLFEAALLYSISARNAGSEFMVAVESALDLLKVINAMLATEPFLLTVGQLCVC